MQETGFNKQDFAPRIINVNAPSALDRITNPHTFPLFGLKDARQKKGVARLKLK